LLQAAHSFEHSTAAFDSTQLFLYCCQSNADRIQRVNTSLN